MSFLDDVLDRPRNQKVAAVAGVLLALIGLDWTYWYGVNGDDLGNLTSKVEDLQAEFDAKSVRARAKAVAERELRDLNAQLKQAAARLPDQREIADLLSTIAASGRAAGLDITLFRQKPEVYHDFYADVPVQMEMRGTYNDVIDFLDRIGRMDRIVNVVDLNLKRPQIEDDRVMLVASCTTTTFRFLDEAERARIAEEKKKSQGKKGERDMSRLSVVCLLGATVLAGPAVAAEHVTPALAVVPNHDAGPEFDHRDRRDPFRPPKLGAGSGTTSTARTPLERYELGQLRLVALIYGGRDSRAVVEDDQGIGYIVKVGTRIGPNGGEVARIAPGQMVVREESTDFYGERHPIETVLELKMDDRKQPEGRNRQ